MANQTNLPRALLPIALKDPFLNGCKLSQCEMNKTSYPVRPRGSWEAEAEWVGEAAGLEEEQNNCTFIGPAGRLAVEVLESIGLPFDKNFLAPNVCLCRPHPAQGSTKQNRTPTISEIQTCSTHLKKIVTLHNPKVIVLVGGQAAKGIMKDLPSIGQIVGKFFGPDRHNFEVDADLYAIWHPAYIIRNMTEKSEWIKQLVRLRDYMLGRNIVK